jgi:2-polyprenyl-3-methyl-5-hydroxy-6-metoxy-1,4-benzoquinol methylase
MAPDVRRIEALVTAAERDAAEALHAATDASAAAKTASKAAKEWEAEAKEAVKAAEKAFDTVAALAMLVHGGN